MKLLLHACCGPCSLEPARLLKEAGHSIRIYYANSNIAPLDEYAHRLQTLKTWADDQGIPVIEGEYCPQDWQASAGKVGPASADSDKRRARCRACYRLRLEETARTAVELGFDGIGTTLSVSPYQYTDIIKEEIERAAANEGIKAVFQDFRPYYDEATRRSRELGMYRQNYCGCLFSAEEAEAERAERKAARAAAKRAKQLAHAEERAAETAALEAQRKEKAEYAAKRAKQRAILKELRNSRSS